MQKFVFFLLFSTCFYVPFVQADKDFCRKCDVMREYHKNHPSKYDYYDDYLKDLEENGKEAVGPREEDLPPDVKFIMEQESVSSDTEEEDQPKTDG